MDRATTLDSCGPEIRYEIPKMQVGGKAMSVQDSVQRGIS